MFESVVLPAPFSPRSACTSPTAASKSTPSFATTPGNRFVIPSIRTAAPCETAVLEGCALIPGASQLARGEAGRLSLRAADHALDEPVHRVQILNRQPLAGRDAHLARLVGERPRELVELPRDDRGALGLDRGPRLGRDAGPERGDVGEVVLDRPVVEAGLPGAVHRRLDPRQVVDAPVVDGRRQPRVWRELLRVRVVADPRDLLRLGVLARGR